MRISSFFLLLLLVAGAGCRAQSTPATSGIQATLDRQIKLTIRSQYNVPPDYTITLGQRKKSDINGFDSLPVTFSDAKGHNKTTPFLISTNNSTLARLEKFDLTRNPASSISTLGRPVRGNPKAKVTIISFDDLECPFCARMNAVLFPGTEQHYGSLVRFIYKDFPLPMHPWAMHAAVDVNCMADQSPTGYWNLVDSIHSHDSEISGSDARPDAGGKPTADGPAQRLDALTVAEGERQHVDMKKLNACIAKQDQSGIRASMKEGDALGVDGTPTLFINGERATGALPQNLLWNIIDRAVKDAGQVPPPQNNPVKPAAAPVR